MRSAEDLAALASGRWHSGETPSCPRRISGEPVLAIRLKKWDLALADLEQGAAWAQSDPADRAGDHCGLSAVPAE